MKLSLRSRWVEPGGSKTTTKNQKELVSNLMADNSVYTPAYRGYAFSSTDNTEDIIATELQHFRIALQIMAGHPEVLSEFKRKVKSDRKSDNSLEEVVLKHEYQGLATI